MNWIQIFDIVWLISLLVLLFLIWRSSEKRLHHVLVMEKTLVDVSVKNAESARQSVQTTQEAVAMLKAERNENVL